jgi:hypothetical protein
VVDLVECHSGSEYAERPIAVRWGGERLEVVEIMARWRIPDGKVFLVRTDDGQAFELAYSELADTWSVTSVGFAGSGGAAANNKN